MNEPDESGPPPLPPPNVVRAPEDPRGSLGAGFGLGCLILIVGPSFGAAWFGGMASVMGSSGYSSMSGAVMAIGWLLPVIALVATIVYFVRKGKPRTAMGIGAAVLACIALGLLLVAACAGLMSGGMH